MLTNKNQVVPFQFKGHDVRTIQENGETFFVANDVCKVLDITQMASATRGLYAEQKLMCLVSTGAGKRNVTCVNESGLYALLFKSRKAEAKAFQLWVTSEVLPAIRRHGVYGRGGVETLHATSVHGGGGVQMELPMVTEVVRVVPNELYEELMGIESKPKRMRLMKLYKAMVQGGTL